MLKELRLVASGTTSRFGLLPFFTPSVRERMAREGGRMSKK